MKKYFMLFFSLSMVFMFAACDEATTTLSDDSALLLADNHTYPEIQKLKGTTWQRDVYSAFITETNTLANEVDTRQIGTKRGTTTISFNSNGTFTAEYENRYLSDWDKKWVNAGTLSYSTQHQSSTTDAFTGYNGNFCNGTSRVVWTGIWRRVKESSIIDNEDHYTWDYEVKILEKVTYTYTVNETATVYNVTDTDITDDQVLDEDADWSAAIAIDRLSAGGASDGKELYFDMSSAMVAPFSDGIYTRQ
jgi:hypothetical protein